MSRSARRPELIELLLSGERVVGKEGSMRAGRPEGVWRGYAEDGSLAVECTYVRGVRHGRWVRYDHRGEKVVEARYFRGRIQEIRAWYEDGSPALRARIDGDSLAPGWQAWRRDGRQIPLRRAALLPVVEAGVTGPGPASNRPDLDAEPAVH